MRPDHPGAWAADRGRTGRRGAIRSPERVRAGRCHSLARVLPDLPRSDRSRDLQTGENSDLVGPLVVQSPEAPPKPKAPQRKSKPITVASTPLIGNYQLPALELLNYPDPAIRPTESREELMANVREAIEGWLGVGAEVGADPEDGEPLEVLTL